MWILNLYIAVLIICALIVRPEMPLWKSYEYKNQAARDTMTVWYAIKEAPPLPDSSNCSVKTA